MSNRSLRSFKYFELELKSLASFLIVNNPNFEELSKVDIWEIETIKNEKLRIENLLNFEPTTTDFIIRGFERNISFLGRELIYIRIISALELFLVQSVRDVFKQTTEPFKSNIKRIELNYSQILNISSVSQIRNQLLNKETRPLSSTGYEDVVKYYKKQLGLDISSLGVGLEKMKYYHQIRHILVHRLGKVDSLFKKQYGFNKTYIQVNEELLLNLFNDVYSYAQKVAEKVVNLINSHSKIEVYKKFKGDRLKLEFDSKITDKVNFLEPEFHFWVGDEIFYLEDLGVHIISKGSKYIVEIWGETEVLKAYKKSAKQRLRTSKHFENIIIKPIPHPKMFNESIILAVSKLLPNGLWPDDTRKVVAAKLGISNSNVDRIIKVLNNRGMHLKPE
ncbi:hypothetical protein [Chryseobacterium sp. G0201]|uniref:hypothetical protein n=1 Tax=Chryseobacterium sp. G0201 TaxID=2487065 RepID=UPI000F4FF108|nr:hypothetical protein [Chryseobacterium sp. G0201]AZA52123.1 hypothetical protein EG348_03430 [Chryseobacterium sp. G0201]